jgi:ferredoxin
MMLVRPLWFIELLKKNFRSRFRLARLSRLPLVGTLVEKMLFEDDELFYLPKDRAIQIEVNRAIDTPINTVLPSQIVHSFIDEASVHWIMDFCICRVSNNCQDYPQDLGCLFLGEAARHIDPRIGRLATREEAHEHIRKASDAGLVHLIGRNKLDTVWLDVGPGERLLTVCNCCQCCCLWKMLPDLAPAIGSKVTKMEGVEVEVTPDCVGCGACQGSCFVYAIRVVDGRAQIGDECRGCGRCVETCPEHAITISVPDLAAIDGTIKRIEDAVDIK